MVNWNRHTKHRYLTFQLQQHNIRRKKAHKALIVESKGAKAGAQVLKARIDDRRGV